LWFHDGVERRPCNARPRSSTQATGLRGFRLPRSYLSDPLLLDGRFLQVGLGDFHTVLMDNIIDGLEKYHSMAEQVMGGDRVKQEFAKIVLDVVYDGFKAKTGPLDPQVSDGAVAAS